MEENTNMGEYQKLIRSPTNKYQTRKKIIDFAKIGEKLSLTGSYCHYCRSLMTVQSSNACRSKAQ